MTFVKHISAKLWTLILTQLLTRSSPPSPNCLYLLQSTFIAATQLFLAAERNFCGLFGSNNENKIHGGQIKVQSTGKKSMSHKLPLRVFPRGSCSRYCCCCCSLFECDSLNWAAHAPDSPRPLPRCSDKLRSDTLSALVKRRRQRENTTKRSCRELPWRVFAECARKLR